MKSWETHNLSDSLWILQHHLGLASITRHPVSTQQICMHTPLYSLQQLLGESWGFYTQTHDDVIKWKHFPHYWPFVRGIQRSPMDSPHKGQWHGAPMFSLICAWTNGCTNQDAADLRYHHIHYDVTVMKTPSYWHRHPHYHKHETVVRLCQVYNGNFYTPKMASF